MCVIDANGMYKKASEINWKLSGWVLRGEFLTRSFQAAFYSVLFKAFKKKIHEWGTKGKKLFLNFLKFKARHGKNESLE